MQLSAPIHPTRRAVSRGAVTRGLPMHAEPEATKEQQNLQKAFMYSAPVPNILCRFIGAVRGCLCAQMLALLTIVNPAATGYRQRERYYSHRTPCFSPPCLHGFAGTKGMVSISYVPYLLSSARALAWAALTPALCMKICLMAISKAPLVRPAVKVDAYLRVLVARWLLWCLVCWAVGLLGLLD
jgi:hypothetical protein